MSTSQATLADLATDYTTTAVLLIRSRPLQNAARFHKVGLNLDLGVLLKAKAEEFGVAAKLIATSADLDQIAGGEKDLNVFKGWRNEVFGKDAIRLRDGKVALSANGKNVIVVEIK